MNIQEYVGRAFTAYFDVLTVVTMKNAVFWVVTWCSLEKV
jgi:hypothetical protein